MVRAILVSVALAIFFPCSIIFANDTKTVTSEYTYYATGHQSVEEAKQKAKERAIIQAIADEFGTNVNQTSFTNIQNRNGKSTVDFQSISLNELQGEWIETIGEPKYELEFTDNFLVVKCKIKGKIRKRLNDTIDLDVRLLRNTPSLSYESTEFKNGDNLYLYIESPVDGYLSVYFIDGDENVFCILPYKNQTTGVYEISGNRPYTFFCKKYQYNEDSDIIDEYVMTKEDNNKLNQLYVVFSPNKFIKAQDKGGDDYLPRMLSLPQFMKWLSANRNKDKNMNVQIYNLRVN